MKKEVLLYGYISDWSAESFINKMSELNGDEELTLRINTGGGDVLSGYGMIAKFSEYKGKKKIKVDGRASSMGAFFLAYSNNIEALNVSEFLLHRAAYPSWYESREGFKDSAEYKSLVDMNKSLRKALENKIDVEKFTKVTGKTLDELFSLDSRVDVVLTAKEAKQIGLIDKINELSADMVAEINGFISLVASSDSTLKPIELLKNATGDQEKNKPENKMTIEELKSKHPDVYATAVNDGVVAGVKKEKERVEAHLSFLEIDPKATVENIKSGTEVTQKIIAEMTVTSLKGKAAASIENENKDALNAEGDKGLDAKKQALSDFEKELDKTIAKA